MIQSAVDSEKRPSTFARWIRFNVVGTVGILVQFGALFMLKSEFRLNYLVATVLAVETAVVHNFLWHERFTWADRNLNERFPARRFFRFNVTTGAFSIIGNVVLMRLLAGQLQMNYLVANAIAIALCSLANFFVSNEWVFG